MSNKVLIVEESKDEVVELLPEKQPLLQINDKSLMQPVISDLEESDGFLGGMRRQEPLLLAKSQTADVNGRAPHYDRLEFPKEDASH